MPGQVASGRVKLYLDDSSSGLTNEVSNFVTISFSGASTDEEDITDSSTTPGTKEFQSGDTDYGTATLTFNRNPSNTHQNTMLADITSGKPNRTYQLHGGPTTGSEIVIEITGAVQSANPEFSQSGGVFKMQVEMKLSGEVDWTPTAWT